MRTGHGEELRRRAEERAEEAPQSTEHGAAPGRFVPESLEAMPPAEARRVLHELRVHQIELEMQNEELRRALRALEDSRARYFDLYDLAPIGYVTLSESGQILEANLTAARMLGVSRSALVKQALTRFIAPEDQDVYFLARRRRLSACELRMLAVPRGAEDASGRSPRVFAPATTPAQGGGVVERDRRWVRLEASGGFEGDGAPVQRVVLIDISERKAAEEKTQASEARHRALFEQARDAQMTLAPSTSKIGSVNAATRLLFGIAPDEPLAHSTLADLSPELQPDGRRSVVKLGAIVDAAVVDGSCFFEWVFLRRSGVSFPATVLLSTMELDGQVVLHASVRDESEMKRLQARLGQADRLATMGTIAAGVAHEVNNPLAHVLYNLESLSQDIPRLADVARRCASALVAHVGNGPFTALAGPHAMVLQDGMIEDLIDRAREALSSTQRIRTISRALGNFSRLEGHELVPVDVNRSIEAAISMTIGEVKYRARLVKRLGALPPILASETRLSQLFLNLVINAAHAIVEGDVDQQHITIASWADDDAIYVEVNDSGRGIAADDLPRVFDPFFTTKAAGEGSGLGLAISKSIVAELHGDLRVESQPGKGARFTVKLPIRTTTTTATTTTTTTPGPELGLRGRVLAIDDEWGIRETVRRVLGHDHEVITLSSGEDARSLLEIDQAFDVILCDLMMPRFTGMELHLWLSERAPALARQVIFLTGGAFTPKASEYLKISGVSVIEKPFDAERLRELVAHRVAAALNLVH
jgi:PAS domain S-box-containing protein